MKARDNSRCKNMAAGKTYALRYIAWNEKIVASIRNPIRLRVIKTRYSECNDFRFHMYLTDEKYAAWAAVSNHCLEQLQQKHQLGARSLLNYFIISLEGSYIELQDYSLLPFLPPEKERCTFLICIQQFAEMGGPSNPHGNNKFVYLSDDEDVRKRLLFLWKWNQPVKQSMWKQSKYVSEKGRGSLEGDETSKRENDNIAEAEDSRNADASLDANMGSFEFSDAADDIYNGKHPPLVTSPPSVAENSIIEKDAEHQNSSSGVNINADQESLMEDSLSIMESSPHEKISRDQKNQRSSLTGSLKRREKPSNNRNLRSSRGLLFDVPTQRNASTRRLKTIAQSRDLDPPSDVRPTSKHWRIAENKQRVQFYKNWSNDKIEELIFNFWKSNRKLRKIDINERLRYIHTFYPKNKINDFAVNQC